MSHTRYIFYIFYAFYFISHKQYYFFELFFSVRNVGRFFWFNTRVRRQITWCQTNWFDFWRRRFHFSRRSLGRYWIKHSKLYRNWETIQRSASLSLIFLRNWIQIFFWKDGEILTPVSTQTSFCTFLMGFLTSCQYFRKQVDFSINYDHYFLKFL